MDDRQGKTLTQVVIDWIASVVESQDGWAIKRGLYRRGITTELDSLVAWLDRSLKASGAIPTYNATINQWSKVPWPDPEDVLAEPFATIEMEAAYRRWDLIKYARELDRLIADGTTNEAFDYARSFSVTMAGGSTPHGIELTDPSLYIDVESDVVDIPSWGDAMAARPIHRSDFVLVAARTGIGKSWMLLTAAIDAIRQGWDVVFYSLEMPYDDLAKRLKMILKINDVPAWLLKQPGHLYVVDQKSNRHGYTASDLVNRVDQGSRTLIIIDYGELMRPDTGGRTTEGWNKSAEVSQALQNVAKYVEVPVLTAVQDNRAAIGQGAKAGPETFSGSDYWGRDADTALRLRDETGEPPGSGPTRVLEVVKSRHTGGRTPTFLAFDPEGVGIKIIDRVEYVAIHARE